MPTPESIPGPKLVVEDPAAEVPADSTEEEEDDSPASKSPAAPSSGGRPRSEAADITSFSFFFRGFRFFFGFLSFEIGNEEE